MTAFSSLGETDKIQIIKDNFIRLVEFLAGNPDKIKEHLFPEAPAKATAAAKIKTVAKKVSPEKAKGFLASLAANTEITATDVAEKIETKAPVEAADNISAVIDEKKTELELEQQKEKENLLLLKEETVKKVTSLLTSAKKQTGCICGQCISTSFMNGPIPLELEPLLEIAKREAEEGRY
jgi:hypothetical protein